MQDFTKGNLVHWENGPSNNVGVVKDLSPRQITVHFDNGEQQTFALTNDVLTRVIFDPGTLVQIQPGGENGVVIGHSETNNMLVYKIHLSSGSQPSVVETSLRPAVITDPLELLRQGKLHSARSVNLRLTATRLLFEHQYGELPSLSNSRVEKNLIRLAYCIELYLPIRIDSYLPMKSVSGKPSKPGLLSRSLKQEVLLIEYSF